MARKPRIQIQGGLYHIITRGNNRQLIFNSDDDYLKMLSHRAAEVKALLLPLHAYCLMPNHIHLLVEQRQDRISLWLEVRILQGPPKK